jgi:hypothetical protein
VDYNVAHWEEYDFCSSGGQVLLQANRNSQAWDFGTLKVVNLARFICPAATVLPRGPVPGQALSWSCTGTNTAVAGQSISTTAARIIATDSLRIGRTVVPVVHQRQQTRLSGGQGGMVSEDWWFEAKSGLPLRMERRITITSSSPVGAITYDEDGFWQMTSMQPRT